MLEVDRLRKQRERDRDDERYTRRESARAREIEDRVDQNQPEEPEGDLREKGGVRPRNFQQDPGEEVHPGWKRMKVVDRLGQPILQVGRIAQPHPVEAEVELKTERVEDQATRRRTRARRPRIHASAWTVGSSCMLHVDCSRALDEAPVSEDRGVSVAG